MRVFWWQLSWDILPTESNLERHYIPIDPMCWLCGFARASSFHTIFDCPFIKQVWKELDIMRPSVTDVEPWMMDYLPQLSHINPQVPIELIAATTWGIWKVRCELKHKEMGSKEVLKPLNRFHINWVLAMVDEYKRVRERERE